MTFAWDGFLRVAEVLLHDLDSHEDTREAKCRTAISRAYYAVFCTAKAHLRDDLGHTNLRRAGSHGDVRSRIKGLRAMDPRYGPVGVVLERLHESREHADYEAEWQGGDLGEVAKRAVESGQRALADLARVRADLRP